MAREASWDLPQISWNARKKLLGQFGASEEERSFLDFRGNFFGLSYLSLEISQEPPGAAWVHPVSSCEFLGFPMKALEASEKLPGTS